jgi:hypothetical protein
LGAIFMLASLAGHQTKGSSTQHHHRARGSAHRLGKHV